MLSSIFNAAKKDLVNKGTKAMYEVLKKGRFHNLSIQCQLDIFDKTVKKWVGIVTSPKYLFANDKFN
jgi:hypothetical protein